MNNDISAILLRIKDNLRTIKSGTVAQPILEEIDALVADRDEFLRQTRLVYERLQPQMTGLLRENGLTDRQVEICCLYALGLNGKTIQQYTRDGRHFQHVGHIRTKLGLGEHDRNIDGYIRSLLK